MNSTHWRSGTKRRMEIRLGLSQNLGTRSPNAGSGSKHRSQCSFQRQICLEGKARLGQSRVNEGWWAGGGGGRELGFGDAGLGPLAVS